ncbi:uncharacterized oxidoreductase YccK-like [Trematomus bernacchii]|uniref:uncharacterized oxidoreductase YccK-like n=1 Tax=Trematomus bernacchii TaxID=40690 RepID=UPI00146BC4C1|nr:uncharacterized oxidoreductase YccK-like [Trematomus bernacchii]XP_034000457.1 uncharacterized oxidoreductase YccK-like [Trematomus bernacchii]
MSPVPKVRLSGGLEICRVLNGMWQVSGAHGAVNNPKAVEAMQAYVDAGLTTFDMADIYGPAEDIFGQFNNQRCKSGNSTPGLQSLTKYVPRPGPMDRKVVLKALQRSMARMHVDNLDCVQFHWWDYRDKRYLDALGHLSDLQQEGLIRELSLTNFDTQRLEEITSRGIRISSNQVQYSLIDQRPAARMEQFCVANNIQLLTYGTLAGGLLSERYLGKTEPNSKAELYTASLSKYKKMIDSWGGLEPFPGPPRCLGDRCQDTRLLGGQCSNALRAGPPCGGRGHRGLPAGHLWGRAAPQRHSAELQPRPDADGGRSRRHRDSDTTLQGPHGTPRGLRG